MFGKHFYQLWQYFYSTGEIFIDVSGQILSKLSSHLVTLPPPHPHPEAPKIQKSIPDDDSCVRTLLSTLTSQQTICRIFYFRRSNQIQSAIVMELDSVPKDISVSLLSLFFAITREERTQEGGGVRRCSFPERRSRWAKNKLKLQKAENKSSSSELSRTILQVKNAVITEFI